MLGIKTYIKNVVKNPYTYIFRKDLVIFNKMGLSKIKLKIKLIEIINNLKSNKKSKSIGDIFSYPDEIALKVWNRLIQYNPNNFGNWSIKNKKAKTISGKSEQELITRLLDLYKCKNKNIEGYVTSGSTEGNIYSLWMARKHLQSKKIKEKETILIKTGLTHFSINKSSSLTNTETDTVGINSRTWGMDTNDLKRILTYYIRKGYKGFIMPLTLGYTLTGTSDSLEEIMSVIKNINLKYDGNIYFYTWIDSASQGLVRPLIDTDYDPFKYKLVNSVVLDFHKFGFAPIPSGIVLYRSCLRKLIEQKTNYLEENDSTLLGSRNGIAPIACNFIIQKYGRQGLLKIINKNLKDKDIFISKLKSQFGNTIKIVSDPKSLGCAIVTQRLTDELKSFAVENGVNFRLIKLRLDGNESKQYIAKAYFINN